MFNVGTQLRRIRKRTHLTLDQLAATSGVDRGTISRIELGHVSPRIETISFLCEAMGTTLSSFFGAGEEAAPAPAAPGPAQAPDSSPPAAPAGAQPGRPALPPGPPRIEADSYWPVPAPFWQGLLEVQERFEALVKNSSELILVLDPEGFIRYASPASWPLLGLRSADLVGHHSWSLIHPGDLRQLEDLLEQLRPVPNATGQMDCRMHHRDGTWHWTACRFSNQTHNPSVLAVVINALAIPR